MVNNFYMVETIVLWRWRESNPRPKEGFRGPLRAYSVFVSLGLGEPTDHTPGQPFRPQSLLSHRSRRPVRHSDFVVAYSLHRSEYGVRQTQPQEAMQLLAQPMRRGAQQRTKCVFWHLIEYADFTRSASLGSPSGTTMLLRRSQSSPGYINYKR